MTNFKLPISAHLDQLDEANSMSVNKGDFGYDLEFTVKDSEGAPIDLTDVTAATLKLADVDKHRTVLSKACDVTEATLGKIICSVEEGDFKKQGNYLMVLSLDFGGEKMLTTNPIFLVVEDSYGT